jgi:hypothetical protein
MTAPVYSKSTDTQETLFASRFARPRDQFVTSWVMQYPKPQLAGGLIMRKTSRHIDRVGARRSSGWPWSRS